jgi:hypothetical protein
VNACWQASFERQCDRRFSNDALPPKFFGQVRREGPRTFCSEDYANELVLGGSRITAARSTVRMWGVRRIALDRQERFQRNLRCCSGLDAGGRSYLLKPAAWPLLRPRIFRSQNRRVHQVKRAFPMGIAAAEGVASEPWRKECTHDR